MAIAGTAESRTPACAPPRRTPAIEARGLSKRYGTTTALSDLDLRVEQGEVYGYLGPNGAGKTTTIRLLLGLHRASAGEARLLGRDCWREAAEAHRDVAYVAGEAALWPQLSGEETLEFFAALRGGVDHRYRAGLVERFELDTSKRVRALSKGNRQKVQLIAALSAQPSLLLLDEPTAGLDPLMEVAFRDAIREARERGQTIFLSSHILSEVEALCDRVGLLRAGHMIDEGTLSEMRHLSSQIVEVTFEGPAPRLPQIAGVTPHVIDQRTLRFAVSGEIAPLIAELGGEPIASLTSREASLEEIFLHHYRADGQR